MNRIRELRKERKMTQKELAAHLEIADSTLSYWEMGRYEPDHGHLKELSKFFHVSIDYILGGDTAEWETGKGRAYNSDAGNIMLSGSAMSVSDAKAMYDDSPAEYDINNTQLLLNRNEFKGLTRDEIEKLAEYARFLKTLRAD